MSCTCNTASTHELTCFNCKSVWTADMDHFEIVANCPVHSRSVAICGFTPPLCDKCKSDGYYIQRDGGGFMAEVKVMKRDL